MAYLTSKTASARLVHPIDGTTITSLDLTNVSVKDSDQLVNRKFARSGAMTAPAVRRQASVSFDRNPQTLDLVALIKRWRDGVLYFDLASDLKGKRYRHPHLELTMASEVVTLYSVSLTDAALGLAADGAPASEAISLNALGGIDAPANSEFAEPTPPIVFFRTGSKTYIGTAGTMATAADGVATHGFPYVIRRNLANSSETAWTNAGSATMTFRPSSDAPTEIPGASVRRVAFGTSAFSAVDLSGFTSPGGTVVFSVYLRLISGPGNSAQVRLNCSDQFFSPTVTMTSSWQRFSVSGTCAAGARFLRIDNVGPYGTPTFEIAGVQLEQGSAVTAYQATNASGVDLAATVNGSGASFAPAATNRMWNTSFETNSAGWTLGGTSTRAISQAAHGAASLQVSRSSTASINLAIQELIPVSAETVYTLSFSAFNASTLANALYVRIEAYDSGGVFISRAGQTSWVAGDESGGGGRYSLGSSALKGVLNGWNRVLITLPATPAGTATLKIIIWDDSAGWTGTWGYLDAFQLEAGAIATSYIDNASTTTGSTATRNPDLAGIQKPHNLLKYSEQFDLWTSGGSATTVTKNNATAPDGSVTMDTISFPASATFRHRYQEVAVTPNATYTVSMWTDQRTGSDSASLIVYCPQTGSNLTSITLLATDPLGRRAVTFVTPSTASSVQIQVAKVSAQANASDWDFWGAQLVEGTSPGVYVRTTDSAIQKPVGSELDPRWVQNGAIEFEMVYPVALTTSGQPNGVHVQYFGAEGAATPRAILRFFRSSGFLTSDVSYVFDRAHNGATGSTTAGRSNIVGATVNLLDGGKHRVRLEWTNYVLAGVRYMLQRLYVDGVLRATADVAALYGASSWLTPLAGTLISGGDVNNVLSNIVLDYPSIPSSARRAA